MPGDPLKKVQSGQPLRIAAETFNCFIDAARDFKRRTQHLHRNNAPEILPLGVVKVRNATGSARERYDIVALGSPLILPEDNLAQFEAWPLFAGNTPSLTSDLGRFAILLQPIAENKMGAAVVQGIAVCRIDIQADWHQRADIGDNESNHLVSAPYGAAEILWREPLSSEPESTIVWARVRLSNFQTARLKAVANETIAAGESGEVQIHWAGSDTGDTETAHLNWMHGSQAIQEGTQLLIEYFQDEQKWIIIAAECSEDEEDI